MNYKKTGLVIFAAVLILMAAVFSGCAAEAPTLDETKAPSSLTQVNSEEPKYTAEATQTIQPEPSVTPEPEYKPAEIYWNPYVISIKYTEAYGDWVKQNYFAVIDAVLTGSDVAENCVEGDIFYLNEVLRNSFPPYVRLISAITYEDGKVYLKYRQDDIERQNILEEFREQVEFLINLADIKEGDSPEMCAIKIYHCYSNMVTYDYEAAASEEIVDVSCYRALMDLDGICQSFASAYAYLCLQCGLEAVTVSGMNEANDIAHEWVLLTLGDKYYYADPTFENGDGGAGLKYFGMTARKRYDAGQFLNDICNIGGTNIIWGRDIDVNDEKYSPLWEADNVLEIKNENGVLNIVCEKADGTVFEFVVE